jgi:hypothetical protein
MNALESPLSQGDPNEILAVGGDIFSAYGPGRLVLPWGRNNVCRIDNFVSIIGADEFESQSLLPVSVISDDET